MFAEMFGVMMRPVVFMNLLRMVFVKLVADGSGLRFRRE